MKILLWDFDGTLAYRENLWSESLLKALDIIAPGHNRTIEVLKTYLNKGFPWHEPMKPHLDLCGEGAWWKYMEGYFIQIYQKLGYSAEIASKLAKSAHKNCVDSDLYNVYPATFEVLEALKKKGWTNYILSNHVPELPQIVRELGFSNIVNECFSSANIGYEKPNPFIYKYVFKKIGKPQICIMIGDNYNADVYGAENVGLNAILLNSEKDYRAKYWCNNILDIEELILQIENQFICNINEE